jgi:hypothetical protein
MIHPEARDANFYPMRLVQLVPGGPLRTPKSAHTQDTAGKRATVKTNL